MKKNLLISILVIPSFSVLFNSCAKDENVIDAKDNDKITSHYILDGIDYPVVMQQKADGTFDVGSVIDEKLSEVLDLPNSTLLQDPFTKNTYHVFRNEGESKTKSTEIIKQMNQFESKFGKSNLNSKLKSGGVVGSFEIFRDNYFYHNIPDLSRLLVSDYEEIPYVGKAYNDVISSYKVWSNTTGTRPDEKRYVIRFYEHANFGGRVLTAYGYFTNWQSGGDYQVSWEDANMHGTLMYGGIFGRKYWGDQVSSIKWALE